MKSVTLHDEGSVDLWDLSSNFVFTENDIGKNRALASVQKLQELNNAVVVTALSTQLTKEQLSDFQVLVLFLLVSYFIRIYIEVTGLLILILMTSQWIAFFRMR